MKAKKITALVLAVITVISLCGILSFDNIKLFKSEYEKAVAVMKADSVSKTASYSFATKSSSLTPGKSYDKSLAESIKIPTSSLSDATMLKYYYESDIYAYGITLEDKEIIALRKANGIKYDMLSGAGSVNILSSIAGDSRTQITNTTVKSFEESTDGNGNKILTVNYNLEGKSVDEYKNAIANGEDWIQPSVKVIYTFFENSIGVSTNVVSKSENFVLSGSRSKLNREHIGGYDHNKEWVKVNSEWIYPDDLDDPYQDFESLAYIYSPDGIHKMFTFFRGEELAKNYATKELRGNSIYLDFEDGNTIDFAFDYSLTFADAESEKQNPDYLGLFRSRNEDFAVGIATEENTENSTVFVGNSVKLNINVTNLKNRETKFSLRYDVRNYYGDVVDAGLFIDNILSAKAEANRRLNISGKYGIYYLNLYAISENSTYKECYPFALLEDYDYSHNETSPFGISTVTAYIGAERRKADTGTFTQDYSQVLNLAKLSAKIGISNARTSTGGSYTTDQNGNTTYYASVPKYVEYMQNLGINRFIAHQGETFEDLYRNVVDELYEGPQKPIKPMKSNYEDTSEYETALAEYNTVYNNYLAEFEVYKQTDSYALYVTKYEECKAEFLKLVKASADSASKFAQSLEYGNEMNYHTLGDDAVYGVDKLYDLFYTDTFLPSFEYVTTNHKNLEYVPTSFSAAESGWLNHLADIDNQNAIWDRFDICSLHIYGQPWMPDSFGGQTGGSNALWNIEDAMIRIENACKTYGDKAVYVTEVGYTTPPESSTSVGLRTQADYTARIGAICLAHGADVIQYYCMTDKVNNRNGFKNDDVEWNFGLFYEPDFFDVIKPKPAGIAYANMTRQLESYVANSGKIDTYDEGNLSDGTYSYDVAGVRAFRLETKTSGEVVVAYSNKEVLANGKKNTLGTANMKNSNLSWNSQWSKTDKVEFKAVADTVRVVDIMGNTENYTPDENGKVVIPLTGSPVYIYGI